MFLSEWREFPSAPCLAGKKKTWWQLASRCCWNCARPWHSDEFVSFLVGLRTYRRPDIYKGKGIVIPLQVRCGPDGWVEVELYSSMTATLEVGEWSAVRPSRTLPPGESLGTHLTGGWVGLRADLNAMSNELPDPQYIYIYIFFLKLYNTTTTTNILF